MLSITIHQSPGCTVDHRRLLMKPITEAFLDAYELPPEAVTLFFQDYEDDMWGKGELLKLTISSSRDVAWRFNNIACLST